MRCTKCGNLHGSGNPICDSCISRLEKRIPQIKRNIMRKIKTERLKMDKFEFERELEYHEKVVLFSDL